jgi:ribonuclease P protein component
VADALCSTLVAPRAASVWLSKPTRDGVRRLKTAQEHERLLSTPVVAKTEHFVLHRLNVPSEDGLRASVLVSKRHARHAVTRNLIRRQLDALVQAHSDQLPPTRHLLRLIRPMNASYSSASSMQLKKAVRHELERLLLVNPSPLAP